VATTAHRRVFARLSSLEATSLSTKRSLSREDWIEAARDELIAKGISAVKVGRLARNLRVTRGSFYWHFSNHQELLRALLQLWESSNTRPFEEALNREGARVGYQEFCSIINLYLEEDKYNPEFDTAVRNWARTSKAAAAAVRRVDAKRIDILHKIFADLGYADPEALVRARITYFHQVGYYAIDMQEDPERRRSLVPVYIRVLIGKSADPAKMSGPIDASALDSSDTPDLQRLPALGNRHE
jgi:AcrR family transcriptional regulator